MANIAFLTQEDPNDRTKWSGTLYSEFYELKKGNDVSSIVAEFNPVMMQGLRLWNRVRYLMTGKTYLKQYTSVLMSKLCAKKINHKLKRENYDVLFAVCMGPILPFVKFDGPVIYMIDAVFSLMVDYYFINLNRTIEKNGNHFEQMSLDRADQIIVASEWTQKGAVSDYHICQEKINVIPFGANLDAEMPVACRSIDSVVKMLFIGAEWERKGGDTAIQAVKILNERNLGLKFELDVIGGHPAYEVNADFIHFHGFINKNQKEGMDQFKGIISQANIFLLPTKAECAGIVFSEVSAYGIPIVAYKTGGTSSYVKDGVNGVLIEPGCGADCFADAIQNMALDKKRYKAYSENGMKLYQEELNWTVWGKKVNEMIKHLLKDKQIEGNMYRK